MPLQDLQYIWRTKRKEIFPLISGIVVAFILWITVFNRDTMHDDSFRFQPLHSFLNIFQYGIRGNAIGNILLFLPVGFMIPPTFELKLRGTAYSGFSLSLVIELLQVIMHRGYFEVDDLICNTLGTILGYLLFLCMVMCISRFRKRKS